MSNLEEEQLLEEIQRGPMKNFIRDVEVSWNDATGQFDDFTIRYA